MSMKTNLTSKILKEVVIPSEWEFMTIINCHDRGADGLERRNSKDLKLTDQSPKKASKVSRRGTAAIRMHEVLS